MIAVAVSVQMLDCHFLKLIFKTVLYTRLVWLPLIFIAYYTFSIVNYSTFL